MGFFLISKPVRKRVEIIEKYIGSEGRKNSIHILLSFITTAGQRSTQFYLPNASYCLFLKIKLYRTMDTPIHIHAVDGGLHTIAELSVWPVKPCMFIVWLLTENTTDLQSHSIGRISLLEE